MLEELVENGDYKAAFIEVTADMGIDVKMQYPLLGMQHAESRCFMRKEVYERLTLAQRHLPEGLFLRVWDAWRPFALQQELFEVYPAKIVEQFHLENASEEEKRAVIGEYIATPNPDRQRPPCHTTGGALDVTLIDADGRELNMGTEFDAFSRETNTDYFEKVCGEVDEMSGRECGEMSAMCSRENAMEICNNRRILCEAMEAAGFSNVDSEWWHYGYGDRNWAAAVGKPVLYEGVFSVAEIESNITDVPENSAF